MGLTQKEQLKAAQGTIFIPFSQFPPRKVRKDCYYRSTPAMVAPKSLKNMHSCENWLPRMVMRSCWDNSWFGGHSSTRVLSFVNLRLEP
ncbi:Very-long-chain aldehyde decarbonylase CER1-like [Theobroma cacao]|nr:Very-long-chain aldehyde decarbonylase CER1-like [Theobroma cacao]